MGSSLLLDCLQSGCSGEGDEEGEGENAKDVPKDGEHDGARRVERHVPEADRQCRLHAKVNRVEVCGTDDQVAVGDRADQDEEDEKIPGQNEGPLLSADAGAAARIPAGESSVKYEQGDGSCCDAGACGGQPEGSRQDVSVGVGMFDAKDDQRDEIDDDMSRQEGDGSQREEAL
jgi:hypothetical protein